MSYNEAEEGRKHWDRDVVEAGFNGDVAALWDSMVAARETSSFALPALDLAADEAKLLVFCNAVRDSFGGPIPDEAIKIGLLAMPRACAWCSDTDSWVWCQTCGGCNMCCVDEFHCKTHGSPFGICHCATSDYRDSNGNPPDEGS
jgi:hypothetical protein